MKRRPALKTLLIGLVFPLLVIVSFGIVSIFFQSQKVARQEGVVLGDLLARGDEEDEDKDEAEVEDKDEDTDEDKEDEDRDEDKDEAEDEEGIEIKEDDKKTEIKIKKDGKEERIEIKKDEEGEQEEREEDEVEFRGVVESISEIVWVIGSTRVKVDVSTKIEGNPQVGDQAKVEARVQIDGSLLAKKIELKKEKEEDEIEFEGIVESISGAAWVVAGKTVNIGTFVKIKGDPKVGDLVEVEAEVKKDGSLWAKEIELEDKEKEENEAKFKGVVESISDKIWIIGGRTVISSPSTEIQGAPKVGDLVEVEGILQDDGSVLAEEIESEEKESELEIEQEEGKTKVTIKTGGVERKFEFREKEGKTVLRMRFKDETTGEESEFELKVKQNKFELKHKGTIATTSFPISIDPETNTLSVTTPAGTVVIKTLPSRAIEMMLSSGLADKVTQAEIIENPKPGPGESLVAIEVSGSKQKKFLGLFNVSAPLRIRVDAQSGETLDIERPLVFRLLSFLFT